MSNTITIELCKEDRQRLDELIAFAGLLVGEIKSRPVVEAPAAPSTAPQSAEEPKPVETEHPVEEVTAPAKPEPVAKPEEMTAEIAANVTDATVRPKYALDDIQALVLKLASPAGGKRDQVRAIVKEYAERVSLIKPDKFAEVMDKLTALDKEG